MSQTEATALLSRLGADHLPPGLDLRQVDDGERIDRETVAGAADLLKRSRAESVEAAFAGDIYEIKPIKDAIDWGKLFGINCYGDECLDLALFAAKIEEKLDGKVTKYAYRVRSGLAAFEKAKGPKRTAADPPASSFSIHDRLNPASVTKTVTAVALLRALEHNGVSIHASIAGFLPSYWNVHPTIQTITFQQVLSHTSGFRTSVADGYEFHNLEKLIETGIKLSDKVSQYENVNYALARILLCYVDGYSINWPWFDAFGTSIYFVNYLNDELFDPVGISNVSFTPEVGGSLFYPFPAGNKHGTAYGNWSLREGSAGIQLSVRELSEFLMRMWTPGTYLSAGMLAELQQWGMGMGAYGSPGEFVDGIPYGKGGYFPGSWNGGAELSSVIIRFASGVEAVLVINGEVNAKAIVLDAYKAAWKPKS